MKKKKTLLLILLFVLTLVGTLGLFTFIIVKSYNDNKTYYYVATKDFDVQTEITELDVNTYFAKVEGTKEYAEALSNNGIVLVTNLKDLIGRTVSVPIAKGDIVTYTKVTKVAETEGNDDFKNPQYIPLSFDASNVLAKEIIKDTTVAIMIDTSLNNLTYATQTTTSSPSTSENSDTTNSNSASLDNASKGRLLSVVCTKAYARNIEIDKTGKYNVLLQMEYEDALNILSLSSNSTLYLLDNQNKTITEKTSLINYNVLANTFASTGLDVSLTDFECWVSRINSDGTVVSTFNFDDENDVTYVSADSSKASMPSTLDPSAKIKNIKLESKTTLQLQWFSYVPYIYIKHYDENGQEVNDYGKYTVANNDFNYNSKTEKSTLKLNLTNGVYEIGFFNENGSLMSTYVFTIEDAVKYTYTAVNDEKIKVSSVENSTYSYSLAISKELLNNLENLNGLPADSFKIDGDSTKYDLDNMLTLNDNSYYYVAVNDSLNFSADANNVVTKTLHFYNGDDELDVSGTKTIRLILKENQIICNEYGVLPIVYSTYASNSAVNYNTLNSTTVSNFQKEYFKRVELLKNVQVTDEYDLKRIFNLEGLENFEASFLNTTVSEMSIIINDTPYTFSMKQFEDLHSLSVDKTIDEGIKNFDDETLEVLDSIKTILNLDLNSPDVNNLDLIKIFLLFKGQYSNILSDITVVLTTAENSVAVTLQN